MHPQVNVPGASSRYESLTDVARPCEATGVPPGLVAPAMLPPLSQRRPTAEASAPLVAALAVGISSCRRRHRVRCSRTVLGAALENACKGTGRSTGERRKALAALAVALGLVALEKPTEAEATASVSWLPMEGLPEEAVVFEQVESNPEWSLDFIIYFSRILLNYDADANNWWRTEVVPKVRGNKEAVAAQLRKRFANFAATVEFGLRRYLAKGRRKSGVLKNYVTRYGKSEESRRQLALAFTLLEDQPLELIAELLDSLSSGARLQAAFSPALPDYLAMDPARLLPSTQYPVWDGGLNRWVVPGLRAAQPYSGDAWEEGFKTSVFGPRGDEVVYKERPLGANDYALFALSGAAGCSFTHSLVIPLDVVKTRAQTEPERYKDGLIAGALKIQRNEGLQALTLGWEPTLIGYIWYGVTVYPGYEFFKRFFLAVAGPILAEQFRAPLVLLAGASATVIACFGVCPAEACRIRMVADPSLSGRGLSEVYSAMVAQDGIGVLYDGLSTILVRQVLFGMMKFLVFDYFADFVFDLFPILAESIMTQLLVSLFSGAVAGVAASIVSQPADTVLSRMNREGGRKSFLEVGGDIFRDSGFQGFFLGLGSRCVWAGCIISGQFFLYDICKSLLGVKDLRVFLDVQL